MKLKICGLRRMEDIAYVNEVRPDYAGFILSAGYRRSISADETRRFKEALSGGIKAVGVFVNAPLEQTVSFVEEGIIDMVQLHGEETEEDIRYLQAVTGVPVIKAVRAKDRYTVEAWLDSKADYLLFDSGTGTGKRFDWSVLEGVDRDYFLAGGLNVSNVEEALACTNPFCLDVSSGVETDFYKDLEKMREFIRKVRG